MLNILFFMKFYSKIILVIVNYDINRVLAVLKTECL